MIFLEELQLLKHIGRDGRCKEGIDQRRESVPGVLWPSDSEAGPGEGGDRVGPGSLFLFYLLAQ